MKSLLYAAALFPLVLISMEPMAVDTKKAKDDQKYPIFRQSFCEGIAGVKRAEASLVAYKESELISYNDDVYEEFLLQSESWSTTELSEVTKNPLLEHQLWFARDGKGFRFDNDTTNDCNNFDNPFYDEVGENLVSFDGPNNDVNQGQHGRDNGVILVGQTYESNNGTPQTIFHLFKQHGIRTKDYQGIQQKIRTNRNEACALSYDTFPYTSDRLVGHTLILAALAAKKRGAIATVDEENKHHLHVFEYTHKENTTNKEEPDQLFAAKIVATANNVPHFKRLVWLYGKTLLGITNKNELYVVALNVPANTTQKATISCIKQQTQKKFKDFALGRPYNHHEMVLVDENDQLYYTNLKERTGPNAAFVLKKINEKKTETKKGKSSHVTAPANAERTSEPWIDKVWIYDNKIGVMWKHQVYRLDFSLMRWPEEKNLQFLSLHQAGWNAAIVNKKLHELYEKYKAKKEKPTSSNKKRSRKR